MRIRQLRYFLRVCELGSITRAASELHIAQPALGLQVRSLEEAFGDALLERGPGGVTVTPAGLLVMEWAKQVVEQERAVKQAVRDLSGPERASLALGLTPSLTYMLARRIVEVMAERLPKAAVRISEGLSQNLVEWVESSRIDLALTFEPLHSKALVAVPVLRERLFYLSKSGEGNAPISLAQVLERPLAVADEQNSMRQAIETAAQSIGRPVRVMHEISSQQVAKEIARAGIAGAITPFGGTTREQEADELSVRMIAEPMIERTLFLVRPAKALPNKAEKTLIDVLYEEVEAVAQRHAWAGAYTMLHRPA
jgi:LysR family nitrogen assimilation transcriptional regulator